MIWTSRPLAELEKLQKDEISAIIKTKRGYSIFKCDGSVVAADFEDSAVQDAVLGYINSNEKSYIENYFLEIAENFVLIVNSTVKKSNQNAFSF